MTKAIFYIYICISEQNRQRCSKLCVRKKDMKYKQTHTHTHIVQQGLEMRVIQDAVKKYDGLIPMASLMWKIKHEQNLEEN